MINSMLRVPFIIAEIGACHEGDLGNAKSMISECADAGFNAVKFQYYDSHRLAARRRAESYLDKYLPYQVPQGWLPILREKADSDDVQLILSVYDEQGADEAAPFADMLKISSFEAEDELLREHVFKQGRPVIISTGMMDEMQLMNLRAIRMIAPVPVTLLHCISAYPAPLDQLDLAVMKQYGLDGFSDHSGNEFMGTIAVALGANMLEVHVRDYYTKPDNPDFGHSISIEGGTESMASMYIDGANVAVKAIGCGRRQLNACEIPATAYKVRA